MASADVIRIDDRRSEPGRCRGVTTSGRPCRRRADQTGFCASHADQAVEQIASSLEDRLERALAFARRRATGAYPTDDFGFDEDLTETIVLPMLRLLYERWWRVEQRGAEHVPLTGPALLIANHSGTFAWDGAMLKLGVREASGRHVRLLASELSFRLPIVSQLSRKTGSALACAEDATRMLDAGHVVCAFPEGFRGLGKRFGERYKLQRFGRTGFVEVALKTGAPIIPAAITGAEETHPMLYNARPLARLFGLPYFPVTPTFPWLGPLGAVPLPTKWTIEYGEPIDTSIFTPDAAMDPMFVFNLTDQIRENIQRMLRDNLTGRRSAFR